MFKRILSAMDFLRQLCQKWKKQIRHCFSKGARLCVDKRRWLYISNPDVLDNHVVLGKRSVRKFCLPLSFLTQLFRTGKM